MDYHRISQQAFERVYGRPAETNADYLAFHGCVFSVLRRGDAVVVHVGCKPCNIKNLRNGCKSFIRYIFDSLPWCKMMIAPVRTDHQTVVNLCHKLGFKSIGVFDDANIMVLSNGYS